MAIIATPKFLARIQSLYPAPAQQSAIHNPWFIAAAVAFSASNIPEAVPLVFRHAVQDVEANDKLLVVRKIKDALFKSGMLSGYPKVIDRSIGPI